MVQRPAGLSRRAFFFHGKLPASMGAFRLPLLYSLAQVCLFFKRHARALEILELLLSEHPQHARAWSIAGFLYAEKGRYKDSIAALERAIELHPDDAAILFNMGFAL
jgi:tetratricopeptide (TPR) repeat protein